MFYVYCPGEARLGSLCNRPGVARFGYLCYSPGEAGRNHSGSSPIWTHSMDEIPAGKLYYFNMIMLL